MPSTRSNRFAKGGRDDNEHLITAVLEDFHIQYRKGSDVDGYDLLVMLNPMFFVEVKNPARPPAKRRLTETEQELKDYCREKCIAYLVIEYPEQMADALAFHARSEKISEAITSDRSSEA